MSCECLVLSRHSVPMRRMELTLRNRCLAARRGTRAPAGLALCDHEGAKAPEALCPLPWLWDQLLQGPGTPAEAAFCPSDLAANLLCQGSEARSHPHSPGRTEAERPLASSLGPGTRVVSSLSGGLPVRSRGGSQETNSSWPTPSLSAQKAWGLGRAGTQSFEPGVCEGAVSHFLPLV